MKPAKIFITWAWPASTTVIYNNNPVFIKRTGTRIMMS
jgi:hypothetical protein